MKSSRTQSSVDQYAAFFHDPERSSDISNIIFYYKKTTVSPMPSSALTK